MISLQAKLKQIGDAFAEVTENCFHYWRPVKNVPCLIWAESGEEDSFHADNHKREQRLTGSVDLFTKTEYDPLADDVQNKLEDLGLAWILNSVQYEEDTNLIHMEWNWSVVNRGEVD